MAEVSNNDLVQTEEEYENDGDGDGDDDDDDVFDIMLNPGGDEGSSFRTRNDPSAPYQRANVTERKGALDIRCACLDVIHGLMSPDADEFATIIVLNFRFDSRKTARRILAVNITLQFAPEQPGDPEPEVFQITPFDSMVMVQTMQTEEKKIMAGVNLGAPPLAGVELGVDLGWERSVNRETTDATRVIGSIDLLGRTYGNADSASWSLIENSTTKTGVPSTMRTAILLKRQDEKPFRCDFKIEAKVDPKSSIERSFQRLFGGRPKDDPLLFDPQLPPTNKLQMYDLTALGSVDLGSLSGVTFQTVLDSAVKHI
ncbi:hypothetical protein COCMIDRAFT_10164 [Bipolaris oryzae ATCC 44560]|uniref:Uncharacterized protein n=1 Tax=Bipolaris oryzae ATCC 44560 TaxID=930090 RepID=W6YWB1_COCMI|nr:uncharacterized protein COCMIDRAFT_10164 [Bipolaris oryzae ATCC 44560]EUC39824.1 hypothetical protein COCMIDRAFT_10164 [Bipolaris oryzae ATCC 44560]